jgi:hypothetical protein
MEARSRTHKYFGVAVGIVLAALLFTWTAISATDAKLQAESKGPLGVSSAETASPATLEALRRAAGHSPMSQKKLHAVVMATYFSVEPSKREGLISQLEALGYRDTRSIQSILYHAGQVIQPDRIITLADALLRREALENYPFLVFAALESQPQLHSYLVNKLRTSPPWLDRFLTYKEILNSAGAVDGRMKTIAALTERGPTTSRDARAILLSKLVTSGATEEAHAIFRTLDRGYRQSAPLSDPKFLAAAALADGAEIYPFEWRLAEGQGFRAQATLAQSVAILEIRWDGRGTPLLASQLVAFTPDAPYQLQLAGMDALPDLTRWLDFSVACEGGEVIYFEQPVIDQKSDFLRFEPKSIPCRFGVFRIVGKPHDGTRSRDAVFDSIMLVRQI